MDLTKMRIKEETEKIFFGAKKEIKIAEIGEFAMQTAPVIEGKALELRLPRSGTLTLSYFGFKGDPEQAFTAEIDLPVKKEDDDYRGPFFFRKAPKFKCASAILQGPLKYLGEAWETLVSEALKGGYKPTGESREVYLSFEGADSPNTIVELQLGIE